MDRWEAVLLYQRLGAALGMPTLSDIATLAAIVPRLRNILGPRPGDDQLDAAEAVLAKLTPFQETPDAG